MTDLPDRLARAGRELLGYGDAALVLSLDAATVLKIGYDGADGWPAWARWCMRRPGPHLPVVHRIELIEQAGAPVAFMAVVERLVGTEFGRRWIGPDRSLKRDPLRLAGLVAHEHPSVALMLRTAAQAFPGARWDAGPSNWMARRDGTIVLTDPLARSGPAALAVAA